MPYAPLIVLGMHRSGTSLATSLLAGAGLDIGQRLLGAHASNPRGHFEDEDFLEFDRQALRRLGADSDGWVAAMLPEPPADLVGEARALVDRKRASGRPWGWKDPRTVPLLPLWRAAVPDAWYAIVVRNPWEVVDSLFRRGDAAFDADPELAVRVYAHYNDLLLTLVHATPDRCVVRGVDAIAADPIGWVRAVAERTSLPLGQPGGELVDPSLRHGQRARAFANVLRHGYPAAIDVFEALQRLSVQQAGGNSTTGAARDESTVCHGREALAAWRDAVAPPESLATLGAWVFGTNAAENAAVLLRSTDGATFRVAIERAGTSNLWDIQLRRTQVPILAGVTYELTFRGRASSERRVAFGVNTRDYRSIGLFEEVTLGEAWRELRASFVAVESDAAAELHFDVGGSAVSVDLADVVLRRLSDGAVVVDADRAR